MLKAIVLFVVLILGLAAQAGADELIVYKSLRRLEYHTASAVQVFPIGLGSAPIGKKQRQGDRKTPEGVYYITHKNPHSEFLLSLGISYPNLQDAASGLKAGIISRREYDRILAAYRNKLPPPQDTALGGQIFVHGRGASQDWTWGCIALDDKDIQYLFDRIETGTVITIYR